MAWITIVSAAVGLFGLVILWFSLEATRVAANAARLSADAAVEQNERALTVIKSTHRPFVKMGAPDGPIVSTGPPRKGRTAPRILLHFYNYGPATAMSFQFTRHSPGAVRKRRYIGYDDTGEPVLVGAASNIEIPPGSEFVAELHGLTDEKWKNVTNPAEPWQKESFRIWGSIEYCDIWGEYHCAEVEVDYYAHEDRWVPNSEHLGPCRVFDPEPADLITTDLRVEILAPCEQPGEETHPTMRQAPR